MRRFLRSTQVKIFLFVFAALLVGIVLAAAGRTGAAPLTKVVSVVFTPLLKASGAISEKVGYASVKTFRRYFIRFEGFNPSEFDE